MFSITFCGQAGQETNNGIIEKDKYFWSSIICGWDVVCFASTDFWNLRGRSADLPAIQGALFESLGSHSINIFDGAIICLSNCIWSATPIGVATGRCTLSSLPLPTVVFKRKKMIVACNWQYSLPAAFGGHRDMKVWVIFTSIFYHLALSEQTPEMTATPDAFWFLFRRIGNVIKQQARTLAYVLCSGHVMFCGFVRHTGPPPLLCWSVDTTSKRSPHIGILTLLEVCFRWMDAIIWFLTSCSQKCNSHVTGASIVALEIIPEVLRKVLSWFTVVSELGTTTTFMSVGWWASCVFVACY